MRGLSTMVIACAVLLGAAVGTADAQSNVGSIKADQVNEEAIRELYDQYIAAWNKHDVPGMSRMWTIDGDHLDPDGRHVKGRDAITKLLEQQHRGVFKETTLDLTIDSVWFVAADVALIDGGYSLTGAKDPQGKEIPSRKGHLSAILIKEKGPWQVAASRLMIPADLPWREE